MKCAHCLVEFHPNKSLQFIQADSDGGWGIEGYLCPNPECNKLNLYLINGNFQLQEPRVHGGSRYWALVSTPMGSNPEKSRTPIRLKSISRASVPAIVPDSKKGDYLEACLVLSDSPKASAA